jgi:hypothetical protein
MGLEVIYNSAGQIIDTINHPDPVPQPRTFNGSEEFVASIKRQADKLARKGNVAAASYLLSKHGL